METLESFCKRTGKEFNRGGTWSGSFFVTGESLGPEGREVAQRMGKGKVLPGQIISVFVYEEGILVASVKGGEKMVISEEEIPEEMTRFGEYAVGVPK